MHDCHYVISKSSHFAAANHCAEVLALGVASEDDVNTVIMTVRFSGKHLG